MTEKKLSMQRKNVFRISVIFIKFVHSIKAVAAMHKDEPAGAAFAAALNQFERDSTILSTLPKRDTSLQIIGLRSSKSGKKEKVQRTEC